MRRIRDSYRQECFATIVLVDLGEPVGTTTARPIEYRHFGAGPTVLVLKGGHSTRDTHLGHERLVDHGFSVLEVSRPGYDRTPASVGRTAQAAANAIAELIRQLGVAPVRLIGISAAGPTTIELARRHPAIVDRVSFESAVALPWDPNLRRTAGLLFGPMQALVWSVVRVGMRLAPSATLTAMIKPLTTLDAATVLKEADAATRQQYSRVVGSLWSGRGFRLDLDHSVEPTPALQQPVLILNGKNDPSVPPSHAERLEAICANADRVEVDAETHFIWIGRAAGEVWDRRLEFLKA